MTRTRRAVLRAPADLFRRKIPQFALSRRQRRFHLATRPERIAEFQQPRDLVEGQFLFEAQCEQQPLPRLVQAGPSPRRGERSSSLWVASSSTRHPSEASAAVSSGTFGGPRMLNRQRCSAVSGFELREGAADAQFSEPGNSGLSAAKALPQRQLRARTDAETTPLQRRQRGNFATFVRDLSAPAPNRSRGGSPRR